MYKTGNKRLNVHLEDSELHYVDCHSIILNFQTKNIIEVSIKVEDSIDFSNPDQKDELLSS